MKAKFGSSPVLTLLNSLGFTTHKLLARFLEESHCGRQEEVRLADMKLPDDRILSVSSRIASFHQSEQINDIELIYYIRHPNGRQERIVQAFPFRYFFRYEVEHLLNLCGFEVAEYFGDYDRSTYSDRSPKMIFVAKKIITRK